MADGTVQRLAYWEPMWMPESELQEARELMDKFEAGLREAQLHGWDGNREDSLQ